MKSIEFSGVARVTGGTGVDQVVRLMLVYDRQTNAAALTVANVLSATTVNAPRSLENRARFTVLYDWRFALSATGEANSQEVFDWKKYCNLPVTFNNGDAGTVADITTGSLYLIAVGTEAAGNTDGLIDVHARVRFVDA